MNPNQTTIASYDQVAEQYVARNHDRSVINESLNRFANYVTPDGLVLDIGCGPGFDAESMPLYCISSAIKFRLC